MFYGLSKYEEEFYADSLLKFAAFAPCIRFAQQDKKVWERSIFKYDDLEIYHFGGLDQIENVSKSSLFFTTPSALLSRGSRNIHQHTSRVIPRRLKFL